MDRIDYKYEPKLTFETSKEGYKISKVNVLAYPDSK